MKFSTVDNEKQNFDLIYFDEDEEDSIGHYGVSYIDGKEVSQKECESYDIGGYQYMETDKSIEEIKGLLYAE